MVIVIPLKSLMTDVDSIEKENNYSFVQYLWVRQNEGFHFAQPT